ncbi:MAG: MBL fold metallo-hydrolase, partial [Coriobacteriia bacterium]|nr:MBL fold metallo-hydrolase [Coriobacteriia bacterium]
MTREEKEFPRRSFLASAGMEITWYGTATIRLRIQGLDLLFDPFVPLPGASSALPVERLLPAPHVLITHGHLDHLCSVPELVRLGAQQVFATATPCASLSKKGVPPQALNRIEPGDTLKWDKGDGSGGWTGVRIIRPLLMKNGR